MSKHHHQEVGPSGATAVGRTDGASKTAQERRDLFTKRAKTFLLALPERLSTEVKESPRRALLFAGVAGFGAGMILGSRILRGALVSAASVLFVDLGRKVLFDDVEQDVVSTFARASREHN